MRNEKEDKEFAAIFQRRISQREVSKKRARQTHNACSLTFGVIYLNKTTIQQSSNGVVMLKPKTRPVHPGKILLEEYLKPKNLSQNRVALDIGVPSRRINEIVLGKRSITADTALRLGRYFQMSPKFWLGLQMDYDLEMEEARLAKRLYREVRTFASAS